MDKERMHWIDNLRTFLCIMVVVYHSARAYGDWTGFWFIKENPTTHLISPFFAINAAYLMQIFFFVSAYFMPGSYDRKKQPRFGKIRNKRMLYPLIFFVIVVMPIEVYFYYELFLVGHTDCMNCYSLDFFRFYYLIYLGLGQKPNGWDSLYPNWPAINLGHIWFLEHLLIYGLFYVLIKRIQEVKLSKTQKDIEEKTSSKLRPGNINTPNTIQIIIFGLIIAIISFIVRIFYPMNDWNAFLYFFQVEWAHFPIYLALVFIGIGAYRHKWIEKGFPKNKVGRIWFIIFIICCILIIIIDQFVSINSNILQGGFRISSLFYVILESILGISALIGFLWIFRTYFNRSSNLSKKLANSSYLVYLIHQPIVVVFQYLLLPIQINLMMKWFIVAFLSVPISFVFSYLLKNYFKFAKKYL